MSTVNRWIGIGNLGRDPELDTSGKNARAKFPIATQEQWTNGAGERQQKTTWHNIVVWGRQAETCGQYLRKGRSVYVEGRIDNYEYTPTTGPDAGHKKYGSQIIAERVRFLAGGERGERDPQMPAEPAGGGPQSDDDIPF